MSGTVRRPAPSAFSRIECPWLLYLATLGILAVIERFARQQRRTVAPSLGDAILLVGVFGVLVGGGLAIAFIRRQRHGFQPLRLAGRLGLWFLLGPVLGLAVVLALVPHLDGAPVLLYAPLFGVLFSLVVFPTVILLRYRRLQQKVRLRCLPPPG